MQDISRLSRKITFSINKHQDITETDAQFIKALIDYLVSQLPKTDRAASVLDVVSRFQTLPITEQVDELPSIYLLLEQFLVENDPHQELTTNQLRQIVRSSCSQLLAIPHFGLIFESPAQQEVLLCQCFLRVTLEYALTAGVTEEDLLRPAIEWIANIPDVATRLPPFNLSDEQLPQQNSEWVSLLGKVAEVFYMRLENELGVKKAERIFETCYKEFTGIYEGLDNFSIVVSLLPDNLLDDEKISLLSHKQIQYVLQKKIDKLQRTKEQTSLIDQKLEKVRRELITVREAAMESATRMGAVLDTIGECIIVIDSGGTIVLVNREIQNIWGYQPEEIVGKPVQILMPETYRKAHEAGLRRYLETGVPQVLGQHLEFEGLKKDGTIFPLELRIAKTRINHRLLFTAAARDITERKRAEETLILARDQALEASRLKSELVAKVSHELRTPLGVILGYTEMMQEGIYGPLASRQISITDQVITSTKNLTTLVSELLDQAQLEAGKLKLEIAPFSPANLISQVKSKMSVLAEVKGLTLNVDIAADVPDTLFGDSNRLQQILINLAGNAIKFTEQGSVHMNVYRPNATHWSLQVSDTGPGIPFDAQTYIFEPFMQVDGSETRKHSGTGLGLSIVKQLTELMGGGVTLESEVGQGSTFTIMLPLQTMPEKIS